MNPQTVPKNLTGPSLRIVAGLCHVMFVFDAARSIDLNLASRRLHESSATQPLRDKRRAPSYLEYRPPPLRVTHASPAIEVGDFVTQPHVDLLLHDFGAITVKYTLQLESAFASLLPLSEHLHNNASLLADSRKRIDQLMNFIGDAAVQPSIAPVVEDYLIFQMEAVSPAFNAAQFRELYGRSVAQILRAEQRQLSDQEVDDSLSMTTSYGTDDVVVIDWNAALIIDPEGEDVREVLQFANVELLEMRHLDERLSSALDQSYEMFSRRPRGLRRKLGRYGTELRTVAELQIDNATLFEGVNNALKLIGDQYLARVYRLASRRFHLDDWDAGILRKLKTLENISQTMSDQAGTRRMEVLEWVIIILFVLSILLELVRLRSD